MRRTTSPARAARRAAPLAVALAALGLAGCQVTNPIQTDRPYLPADGVAVDLGDVQIRNLVVVADEEGGAGTVSGSVVNRGTEPATVTIAAQGGAIATVEVPPHGHQQISEDEQVVLPTVAARPGGLATVQISTTNSGANVVKVPVLPPQDYYEGLAPTTGSTPAS